MRSFLFDWGMLLIIVVGIPRMILRIGQRLLYPRDRRAASRRFSMSQYRTIMNRAGWQCEKHRLMLGRCTATENLEADHFHPHSRGGDTALENGQALCTWHNTLKGARVPFIWNRLMLQRRRKRYFPEWADRHIVRIGVRTKPKRKRRTGGRKRRKSAYRSRNRRRR